MCAFHVAVIGTHDALPHLIRSIEESDDCSVDTVVTGASGDSLASLRSTRGFTVHETRTLNDEEAKAALRERDIDIGVCLGWYEVVEPDVLALPGRGIVGLHAAPLPDGRGQAPVNWQLILGRDEAVVSVFEFIEEVDAGPIYGQRSVPILAGETAGSLYDRVLHAGIEELTTVLSELASNATTVNSQNQAEATYWPERRPEDSLVDWALRAPELERFVQALTGGYPAAYTYLRGRRVIISQAAARRTKRAATPGEVVGVEPPTDLHVGTADGVLAIQRIGHADAPVVTGSEFGLHHGLDVGDTIGTAEHFPETFTYTGLRGPDGRSQLLPETNAKAGETVVNSAYCFYPGRKSTVNIEATVDGEALLDETPVVEDHDCVRVEFTPPTPGAYLLRVRFGTDDERMTYIYAG